MNRFKKDLEKKMRLYAVTGRKTGDTAPLAAQVELAVKGGATFVQLREKHTEFDEFLSLALDIKKVCRKYDVPFVINDNIEVALRADADGVHIGQSDESLARARELLGGDKIIGVSVQNAAQAVKAEQGGADYLGIGSVFSTSTKLDAVVLPMEELKKITASVSIPTVAIGGISKDNAELLRGTGVDGIAVVSAIFGQEDVLGSARVLKDLCTEVFG